MTIPTDLSSIRALVVDDSASMRSTVRSALKAFGLQKIDDAEDGRAALTHLARRAYDIVILDWNMPVMTGIELLRIMRADHAMKVIPVIMLTAEAEKGHVVEAIGAGITDYIVKPFTTETLKKKLDRILEGHFH